MGASGAGGALFSAPAGGVEGEDTVLSFHPPQPERWQGQLALLSWAEWWFRALWVCATAASVSVASRRTGDVHQPWGGTNAKRYRTCHAG